MMITKTEFIERLKKDLRGKRGSWLFLEYRINNSGYLKVVQLKIFNTFAQIFTINGIDYSFGMPDLTKKEFVQRIADKIYG